MDPNTTTVQQIRDELEAADSGQWRQRGGTVYGGPDGLTPIAKASIAAWSKTEANATLIANAPAHLAALLDENERLRAAVARLSVTEYES